MYAEVFQQAMVYLAAAVLAVPIARRLGLGSALGYLLAGPLVDSWGVEATMLAVGGGFLLTTIAASRSPGLREMDVDPGQGPPPPPPPLEEIGPPRPL